MKIGDTTIENGVKLVAVEEAFADMCAGCYVNTGNYDCEGRDCTKNKYILVPTKAYRKHTATKTVCDAIQADVEKAVGLLTNMDNRKNPALVQVLNDLLTKLKGEDNA